MSDVRARRGAAEMLRTIALSSRPLSWVNTAFPFAAAYLTVTRELDLTAIHGTLYFLIPYNLAMYGINDVSTTSPTCATRGRAARRARCSRARCTGPCSSRCS